MSIAEHKTREEDHRQPGGYKAVSKPASSRSLLDRLRLRNRSRVQSSELYQQWPRLSPQAATEILMALVRCGNRGCSEADLPSILDYPENFLKSALGQLGHDGLVSHTMVRYRSLFGFGARAVIQYSITDHGREYLGAAGWVGNDRGD